MAIAVISLGSRWDSLKVAHQYPHAESCVLHNVSSYVKIHKILVDLTRFKAMGWNVW